MIESVKNLAQEYPWAVAILQFLGVILLATISYFVAKRIIIRGIHSLVKKTQTKYDDIFLNKKVLKKFAFIAPPIVINQFKYLIPEIADIVSTLTIAIIVLLIILIINNLMAAANEVYETITEHKRRPIKGYIQVANIIIFILGSIFIIGILTGQNILELLAGVGAMTAIILLIFKDTILAFVASIQITSYDLVKVGDWIEVPAYGVDGDVMDIALHTVKIRNWDKTITTVPTNKLIEVSFKNWRGMEETGGRRIKRSIHIDLSSVKFCDENMLNRFKKFKLLTEYIDNKLEIIKNYNEAAKKDTDVTQPVNVRNLTNLGTFRAYLKAYLNNREDIHKDLTFLVRQLPPGKDGLPIEIYVFTNTTQWVEYEDIQADIFDQLFAVIPEFELRLFQLPTGNDVKSLRNKLNK